MRIFCWKPDCFEEFAVSLMFLLVINSVFIQRVKYKTFNSACMTGNEVAVIQYSPFSPQGYVP